MVPKLQILEATIHKLPTTQQTLLLGLLLKILLWAMSVNSVKLAYIFHSPANSGKNDVRIYKTQFWQFVISVKNMDPMILHASRAHLHFYFVHHWTKHFKFFPCCTHTPTLLTWDVLHNFWQHVFHDNMQFARNTFCSTENIYHMQQPLLINTRHKWSSLMAGHKSSLDYQAQFFPCLNPNLEIHFVY
jgi:hypothetical protein